MVAIVLYHIFKLVLKVRLHINSSIQRTL